MVRSRPLFALAWVLVILAAAFLFAHPSQAQTIRAMRSGQTSQPCINTTATAADSSSVTVCAPGFYELNAATGLPGSTASEAHIGEVGGNIIMIAVNPTVSASPAYSSGDVMGGLMTFANVARVSAGSGLLQSVTLNFKSAQTAATDFVWCGGNNPTGTTLTDNAAVAVAAADYNKCRVIHVTDCTSLGTPSVCAADNLAFPFALTSGTTGYGFLITRGTPTLASTSDVEVALRILRN